MFYVKANVVTSMKKEDGSPRVLLRTQPFATPEKVNDVAMETYRNVKTRLPSVQRSMTLYLANRDTEAILFRPIKVSYLFNSLCWIQYLKLYKTDGKLLFYSTVYLGTCLLERWINCWIKIYIRQSTAGIYFYISIFPCWGYSCFKLNKY